MKGKKVAKIVYILVAKQFDELFDNVNFKINYL